MTGFHFGSPARRLYGVFHPAEGGAAARRAVLVVAPLGQEAIRAHRLFRVIAERLGRQGAAVLRFDRYGCGDAAGDDADGELVGWRDDVVAAAAELKRLCPGVPQTWLGARLGATLALQAASGAADDARPDTLLAWEPVLDGRAYLGALWQAHVKGLRGGYTIAPPAATPTDWAGADPPADGLLGFDLGRALVHQLLALVPAAVPLPRVSRRVLLLASGDPSADGWARAAGAAPAETAVTAESFEWTSDQAINSALVPAAIVRQVVALADDT